MHRGFFRFVEALGELAACTACFDEGMGVSGPFSVAAVDGGALSFVAVDVESPPFAMQTAIKTTATRNTMPDEISDRRRAAAASASIFATHWAQNARSL